MTFDDWFRKRWAVIVILCGLGAGFSELFISSRYSITIGILLGWAIGYLIFIIQRSGNTSKNLTSNNSEEIDDDFE
jgi:NhaP-type Na+/H+ or K+/H+ antiporter